MRIKNGLTLLAGAMALACSGAALAQTSAGPNGTIFIEHRRYFEQHVLHVRHGTAGVVVRRSDQL